MGSGIFAIPAAPGMSQSFSFVAKGLPQWRQGLAASSGSWSPPDPAARWLPEAALPAGGSAEGGLFSPGACDPLVGPVAPA
eukprot:4202951-Lingulodinium_polyedra.AAC.1